MMKCPEWQYKKRIRRETVNTIFIAGHARLPSGMAAKSMYETLTITAEIDKKYGVIVSTSCTLATVHAQQFFERLLIGYSFQDGIEERVTQGNANLYRKARSAVHTAVKA